MDFFSFLFSPNKYYFLFKLKVGHVTVFILYISDVCSTHESFYVKSFFNYHLAVVLTSFAGTFV